MNDEDKKTLDCFLGLDNPFQLFYKTFSKGTDEALQSGLFVKHEDGNYRLSEEDLRGLVLSAIAGRSVFGALAELKTKE